MGGGGIKTIDIVWYLDIVWYQIFDILKTFVSAFCWKW
jgi:hypothetical protein